jgi:hypothetical protein
MSTLPWLTRRGALALWYELPRGLAAGALAVAAAVPLGLAAAAGAPAWLIAGTAVPPAIVLTGLARFATAAVGPERPDLRLLRQVDPALAGVLAAGTALAAVGLLAGGVLGWAGAALGAILLLVAPVALVYGPLRGRTGLAALRGGLILVAYRPVWALTLLALGCLLGFAAVASVGVLALVAVPLALTIAASVVAGLLDEIDGVAA